MTHLLDLPLDVTAYIFNYVNSKSVLNIRLVSRILKNVILNKVPTTFKVRRDIQCVITEKIVKKCRFKIVTTKYMSSTVFEMFGERIIELRTELHDKISTEILSKLKNITRLHLTDSRLNYDKYYYQIPKELHKLKHLTLEHYTIFEFTEDSAKELTSLTHLTFYHCDKIIYNSLKFIPNLTAVIIKGSCISIIEIPNKIMKQLVNKGVKVHYSYV